MKETNAIITNLNKQIGDEVRAQRKYRGWNQKKLAEKADLTEEFISKIERGRVQPSFDSIYKVAAGLKLNDPHELLQRAKTNVYPKYLQSRTINEEE